MEKDSLACLHGIQQCCACKGQLACRQCNLQQGLRHHTQTQGLQQLTWSWLIWAVEACGRGPLVATGAIGLFVVVRGTVAFVVVCGKVAFSGSCLCVVLLASAALLKAVRALSSISLSNSLYIIPCRRQASMCAGCRARASEQYLLPPLAPLSVSLGNLCKKVAYSGS